ncbi:MAG: sodium-translocating pyrophosphatase [Bacilli bacterium]|nr:sodium-translocating pyrophosphatase [Bacilli bacterium]
MEFIIVSFLIILSALITLAYVFILFRKVKMIAVENEKADEISQHIREGAMAFLAREYRVIIPFVVVVALVLGGLGFIPALQSAEGVGWQSSICFIVGCLFSGLAGLIGMLSATRANVRTASKAEKEGMSSALRVAFSGGAILGLSVVGLGLLGLTALFFIFKLVFNIESAASIVSGYGLGCSFIALFGRVGGGIYTKAADVGADLVGKVESGIPEDDPRNPAVIADNVGDNVGDIAGMGSDLTESYVGAIISCLTMAAVTFDVNNASEMRYVLFPLIIAGVGLIAAILSVIIFRARKWNNPHKALNIATYIATGIVVIVSLFLSIFYVNNWKIFIAVLAGLLCGIAVGFIAEIYTSSDYKEVKKIAEESQTGHATNIIAGLGSGMKSTFLTILVLVLGIALSYFVGKEYGIAVAAVSMLSTAGITVSVDGYGPISDNAGGIAEMSHMPEDVRKITDTLDSVGNTTAAIGKGFCIGSATFTALALIISFCKITNLDYVELYDAKLIVGLLIGGMLPFLFSSLVIESVGRAANKMIEEVRDQFKRDPDILKGKSKPDYARCVAISTGAALKEMVLPGIIAFISPIAGGVIFGSAGLGGMLIGGLLSAIMLAVFMANSGGAWDNAKKFIEQGNFGGKGSDTHKAAVTGDTVGDPLKDTAGPAMDILIKLMSIISLVIGPVIATLDANGWTLWALISKLFN